MMDLNMGLKSYNSLEVVPEAWGGEEGKEHGGLSGRAVSPICSLWVYGLSSGNSRES